MPLSGMNISELGVVGGAIAVFVVLWKVVATPIVRLIRPQAANDLTEIKAAIKAVAEELHAHRNDVAREMEMRRTVEGKLFDRLGNLAQRVARIEGEHRAGAD